MALPMDELKGAFFFFFGIILFMTTLFVDLRLKGS